MNKQTDGFRSAAFRILRIVQLAGVISLCLPSLAADDRVTQRLTIQFRDATSAARAGVEIEGLYDGHYRAVSCRWDDNWTSDNPQTRTLMEEFGIRGTWYLNDREFSPENHPADYLPVAKELLQGGNSIGGHSLTHPFITYFHSNRMFQEMSGVRIAWEAALDRPVLSYAYSFVDVCPGPERAGVQRRTLDSLTRAGFDHVAEYLSFFDNMPMHQELSPIMPPENNTFEQFRAAVDWAWNDPRLTRDHPMITNSMHAWYGTQRLPYGYEELRKRFTLLTSLKNVWHCNQNQYAGYRRQYRASELGEIQRTGDTLTLTLTRPALSVLNDDTPLTLAVTGVSPEELTAVTGEDCEVIMSQRTAEGRVWFHVPQPQQHALPKRIGHIANPENTEPGQPLDRDADFPSLAGGLCVTDQQLSLWLEPAPGQTLSQVRVVWRAPIGYDVDTAPQSLQTNGNRLDAQRTLAPSTTPDARWGREHFAAQVDFRLNGEAGRLHLTCQRAGTQPDASLPRDGFSLLGPVALQSAGTDELVQIATQQWEANRWEATEWMLPGLKSLAWRTNALDGYVRQDWMNPEYIRTMGTWDANSPTYLLRTTVQSPDQRRAQLVISHPTLARVLVNGRLAESGTVELDKGENRLLIVYPGCTLGVESQRLTACFLRLTDPETGQRMPDIRYRPF